MAGFLSKFYRLYRTGATNDAVLCNCYVQRRLLSSHTDRINGHDSILPVLIVGAGPVGLVLSILLTKLGVKCAVVEKSRDFSRHPQAHFINNRSMEVFRKLDGLADEILRYQPPVDLWRKFIYCTSLTGPILGSVDHMQPQDFDRIVSPVSVAHFSQYKLMRLLIKQLKTLFFKSEVMVQLAVMTESLQRGKYLLGHECTSINATENNVTVTVSSEREESTFLSASAEFEDFSSRTYASKNRIFRHKCSGYKALGDAAEVADEFLAGNNRIILAGDAAHRFPPAGGFGMNTGIQDAHNLAWKLASVLKGIAQPSILFTYKQSIATFNTALSVENLKQQWQFLLLYVLIQALLILIFEEGKSLQLQFPAEDLGFRYSKGALISDGDSLSSPPEHNWTKLTRLSEKGALTSTDEIIPCQQWRTNCAHMDALSTLDLVSVDNVEFVLIIAPINESYQLAQAAFKVAEEFKVPLKVCVMWQDEITDGIGCSEKALSPWKNYIDVIKAECPETSVSWWDLCRMTDRGAILVRPDEHIAWRAKSEIRMIHFLSSEVFSAIIEI
ncbi:hypothetical protein BUALT_Bualt17G0022900 [Buddleja alternifolia]|uniref:FAD-binding domain-containing protein n=1 Tax=Buddleja alternifolia TaxID=168488 RepID=A0AAV6WEW2_9LAMI|nr:hypothetical protein BUALT_Bualt17G0022900 [Buddleja alternifolia]